MEPEDTTEPQPTTDVEEVTEPAHEPEPLKLTLDADYCPRLNLAMQQHGLPLLRELLLTVDADDQPLDTVTVRASLANGEVEPAKQVVDRLEPGETYHLDIGPLSPRMTELARRTEAEHTTLQLEATAGERTVTRELPVELLAYDQWPGVRYQPDLLAAFVTPNSAGVAELLGDARESLRNAGHAEGLDGYQSASQQRVLHLAQAGYAAIAKRDIGYANPPASFEKNGQRIRLVDRILREKLGTCLDLTLLVAAVWEQMGLHPVLLLPLGHAMVAVWTRDTQFPDSVIDDVATIRNRIATGDLLAFETTLLAHRDTNFADAQKAASDRLQSTGDGFLAIDVRAARKQGVRPIPLRDAEGGQEIDADAAAEQAARSGLEIGGDDHRFDVAQRSAMATPLAAEVEESPSARVQRWLNRLLDLSLRNRLINFRETSKTLKFNAGDVADLEDRLSDGQSLRLRPTGAGVTVDAQRAAEAIAEGELFVEGDAAQAEKSLLGLYRQVRTHLQETGSNTLYLVIGMLVWYETPTSDTPRRAPLILMPVSLKRKTGSGGYVYELSITDEPRRPNVTLLEKLAADFGIDVAPLQELPEDESGIDVEVVLHRVRQAVAQQPRWEVDTSAWLGIFSFSKYLMWRDLKVNLPQLKSNKLVEHLIAGGATRFAADAPPLPDSETLDEQCAPGDLLCTRDADSSQLAAVKAAAEGRTFVLEGPPGTGKSQTISNLIANAVGNGQRVLFVAEKMAALTVVRSRLEHDGLGKYCLELHSAKANKKEVLAQIGAALDDSRKPRLTTWQRDVERLAELRENLNAYADQIHDERPSGETLYQVLGRLLRLGDGPSIVPAHDGPIEQTTEATLERWRTLTQQLSERVVAVSPAEEHPLRGIGPVEWGFSLREKVATALQSATKALSKLKQSWADLTASVGLEAEATPSELKSIVQLLTMAVDAPAVPESAVSGKGAGAYRDTVRRYAKAGREHESLRSQLLVDFEPEFLKVDPLPLLSAIAQAERSFILLRWWRTRGVRASLRPYIKPGQPSSPSLAEAGAKVRMLRDLNRQDSTLDELRQQLPELQTAAWSELDKVTAFADEYAMTTEAMTKTDRIQVTLARIAQLLPTPGSIDKLKLRTAAASYNAWLSERDATKSLLLAGADTMQPNARAWMDTVLETLGRWGDHLDKLQPWSQWQSAVASAKSAGLAPMIDALRSGTFSPDEVGDALERGFGRAWFNATADAAPAVRQFDQGSQEKLIGEFRKLDHAVIDGASKAIHHAVASDKTTSDSFEKEMSILQRELEKKSRHKPPRELIAALPTVMPKLKRCFLMSPLSVAQYLDPGAAQFDLVVFDEASQIPPWDAVGAMARGTSVIVVGDSKQLPPTNFFGRTVDEDEELEDDAPDDMESILEECNAARVPSLRLRWHYRSRHESLIAFSNRHYYANELNTFPSPDIDHQGDAGTMGVAMRYLEQGIYDKGGNRTNRVEAETVAAEVVKQLQAKLAGDETATGSIGIVTFNQPQQTLIEDLLDAARREHPEIEDFFGDAAEEPVFVKNLENVQGDERDFILFSTTYGPDKTGARSMNFGPLNKPGGERRLNVAITRARKRLLVVSSMRAEHLDLNRTRAVGVRDFKTFLDFADRGPAALADARDHAGREAFEAGFEKQVAKALTDRGHTVHTQVGVASYRVDLAIVDPNDPGRYLLGIECDGPTYHAAATARDRDRLRQEVLQGLGWHVHRVWSTDWWLDREASLARIESALAAAK